MSADTATATSSSTTTTTPARMMNFSLVCDNETVNCHVEIPSDQCLFLWIGQDSTRTMAYGLLKHRSVIYGQPTPHTAIQITEFADRLAGIYNHQRQVFVSTDLDKEFHSHFWGNLFACIRKFIAVNADFFKYNRNNGSTSSSPVNGPATPASTVSSDNSATDGN